MDSSIKKRVELELKSFKNPSECKTIEQLQMHIKMLCSKIKELESQLNYVPTSAYELLAAYNARQNRLLYNEFSNAYC